MRRPLAVIGTALVLGALVTTPASAHPPDNTVPQSPLYGTEDQPLVFSSANGTQLSVEDFEVEGFDISVQLEVEHGILTLDPSDVSEVDIVGGADGSPTVTMTASMNELNDAMDPLTFTPEPDYVTPPGDPIELRMTSTHGSDSSLSIVEIIIDPVNDPPVITQPEAATVIDQDTMHTFGTAGDLFHVTDIDAGTGDLRVTIDVDHGTLTLAAPEVVDFSAGEGDGSDDPRMVFTGDLAELTLALESGDGLVYTPADGYVGSDALTMVANDLGNTGTGGPLEDSATHAIEMRFVAPPPPPPLPTLELIVPGPQRMLEDEVLEFDVSALGTAANIEATVEVDRGTFSLAPTERLDFTIGDGSDDARMRFSGHMGSVDSAMSRITYRPPPDFVGDVTFTITLVDLPSPSASARRAPAPALALTVSGTVPVTVLPVNDPPVNTLPALVETKEGVEVLVPLSVDDIDAGDGQLQFTLSVTHGTLSLASLRQLTLVDGDGHDDASVTFRATLAAANAALDEVLFTPARDFHGGARLRLISDDRGRTGAGGALRDSDAMDIRVLAQPDEPLPPPAPEPPPPPPPAPEPQLPATGYEDWRLGAVGAYLIVLGALLRRRGPRSLRSSPRHPARVAA